METFYIEFKYLCQDKLLKEELITKVLGKYSPKNLKNVVEASHGISGAVIKQACQAAIRTAILNGKNIVKLMN